MLFLAIFYQEIQNVAVAKKKDRIKNLNLKYPDKNQRLYRIWKNMKGRCFNKNCPDYYLYGERGIKICDEWLDFSKFSRWALGSGYKDNLSIDRIDVNGNYDPNNCRWATQKQQSRNRRNNHKIMGKSVSQWAEELKINRSTLSKKLKKCEDEQRLIISLSKNKNL